MCALVATCTVTASDIACSSSGVRGEVMLVFSTDLEPGKDLDQIDVKIVHHGSTQASNSYSLGPTATLMPTTFEVYANVGDSDPFTVEVTASLQGAPLIYREATTTILANQTLALPIPLEWLCSGSAPGSKTMPGGASPCPTGETCVAGECVTSTIDATTLVPYTDIFGGSCFDVLSCMSKATAANLDVQSCSFQAPTIAGLNIALALPPGGDGICNGTTCYVPLSNVSGDGWTATSSQVNLPVGVCQQFQASSHVSVVFSTQCTTKLLSTATCGNWSSVGSTNDAGATSTTFFTCGESPGSCSLGPIAADDKNVYYVQNGGGTVWLANMLPLTGGNGTPTVLGEALDAGSNSGLDGGYGAPAITDIASDGQFVYWLVQGQQISRVSVAGGQANVIVTAPPPYYFAMDATNLYWLSMFPGAINAIDKTSLSISTLQDFAPQDFSPGSNITTDGSNVYVFGNPYTSGAQLAGTDLWVFNIANQTSQQYFPTGPIDEGLPCNPLVGFASNAPGPFPGEGPGPIGCQVLPYQGGVLVLGDDPNYASTDGGVFQFFDAIPSSLASSPSVNVPTVPTLLLAHPFGSSGKPYWALATGELQTFSSDGSTVVTLATSSSPPTSLAVNSAALFWSTAAGTINRLALTQ